MATAAPPQLGLVTSSASLTAELEQLATRLRRATVRISTPGTPIDGIGAGLLWPGAERPLVLTNAHVAPPRRGDLLIVENAAGVAVEAEVIARTRDLDLALLIPVEAPTDWSDDTAVLPIGDARALRAGELVVALGHPFGVGGALSVGVLHAVPNGDDAIVRADIRLAPGNSGGPLATLDGAVIGVNCMIARGLGIAIAARAAERFVDASLEANHR